jgi:hypothetical protein
MSEDAFDKLIKEKVFNFSDPEEKGDGKPSRPEWQSMRP